MERLPFFVETIESWKNRKIKELEDSFGKKEQVIIKKYGKDEKRLQDRLKSNSTALKQQKTRVMKTYSSIKGNAENVILWLAKEYPDLLEKVPQESREWIVKSMSALKDVFQ